MPFCGFRIIWLNIRKLYFNVLLLCELLFNIKMRYFFLILISNYLINNSKPVEVLVYIIFNQEYITSHILLIIRNHDARYQCNWFELFY